MESGKVVEVPVSIWSGQVLKCEIIIIQIYIREYDLLEYLSYLLLAHWFHPDRQHMSVDPFIKSRDPIEAFWVTLSHRRVVSVPANERNVMERVEPLPGFSVPTVVASIVTNYLSRWLNVILFRLARLVQVIDKDDCELLGRRCIRPVLL